MSGRLMSGYQVYIVRCADGSLYTGIAVDARRRFEEHREGGAKAAKYTRAHGAVALEAVWDAADRAEASRLEFRIKRLSRAEKLALIAEPERIEGLR